SVSGLSGYPRQPFVVYLEYIPINGQFCDLEPAKACIPTFMPSWMTQRSWKCEYTIAHIGQCMDDDRIGHRCGQAPPVGVFAGVDPTEQRISNLLYDVDV